MRAALSDVARLRRGGYRVEPFGREWTLLDADGAHLMIGEHGCVAPTQWEAVAEGLERIGMDSAAMSGSPRICSVCGREVGER